MEFIKSNKNKVLLLIILLMVITLIILIYTNTKNQLQAIKFIDSDNKLLKGSVYIDNNYVAETNGYFKELPDDFCAKEHEISLVKKEAIITWVTYPSDCKSRELILSTEVKKTEKQIEIKNIILKFMVKETKEPLSGSLFFDNEFIANITGDHPIQRELCEQIKVINLTTADYNIEWQHQAEWCKSTELLEYINIEYLVPKAKIETLLNQS